LIDRFFENPVSMIYCNSAIVIELKSQIIKEYRRVFIDVLLCKWDLGKKKVLIHEYE
tara:strand:- start:182 stop:352 length:171 start_codon:yes stop_codon:yes gene_type:complete